MLLASFVAGALAACVDEAPNATSHRAPIVRGEPDDSPERYPGVVYLESSAGGCTGTLLGTSPPYAYVLTAAHCFWIGGPMSLVGVSEGSIVVGKDRATGSRYPFDRTWIHQSYTKEIVPLVPGGAFFLPDVHDLAIVRVRSDRATDALAALALAPLTPAEDDVTRGTTVALTGFGLTLRAPEPTIRQRTTNTIQYALSSEASRAQVFTISQRGSLSGACYGDSGGPLVVSRAGRDRVAGVVSAGSSCDETSIHMRASSELDAFISPTLRGAPPDPTSCRACAYRASQGACSSTAAAVASTSADFLGCLPAHDYATCRAGSPAGADAYEAHLACLEHTGCPASCGAGIAAPSRCRWSPDYDGACGACLVAHADCCNASAACALDTACTACLGARSAACMTNALYARLFACFESSCETTCAPLVAPPPMPDAGVRPRRDAGQGFEIPDSGVTPPDAESAREDAAAAAPDSGTSAADAGKASSEDDGGCSVTHVSPAANDDAHRTRRPLWLHVQLLVGLVALRWIRRRRALQRTA